jgi:hypothetical protein
MDGAPEDEKKPAAKKKKSSKKRVESHRGDKIRNEMKRKPAPLSSPSRK